MTTARRSGAKKTRTSTKSAKEKGGAHRPASAKAKKAPAAKPKKVAVKATGKSAAKVAPPKVTAVAAGRGKAATATRPGGKTAAEVRKAAAAAAAEVRPLGVLPPGSIARSPAKPAAAPAASRATSTAGRPTVAATVDQKLTEKDLQEFEQRLLEERRKILKEMGHLENTVLKINQRDSAGDLSGYSFHMADVGTDAMEREKAFLFASAEGRTLLEINEALRRVYRGEYGVCESCGLPIARARLEAMPHARLCVICKEKEERAQRGAS